MVLSSLVVGEVPKSAVDLLGDSDYRKRAAGVQKGFENLPGTYGRISIQQEGGCKARVVCLPSFWIQAYYRPLQEALLQRVKEVEKCGSLQGISCMYDQNRGAYVLREWMLERKKLWSFDLSSATDRFPLDLQCSYLKSSGLGSWVKPVQEVARGRYYYPYTNEEITYSVGQPMGVNFSFPLFHLTHLVILDSLSRQVGCRSVPCYAVLGDDVIIADRQLAKAYRVYLEDRGVKFSEAKSFEGTDLGSFAGFTGLITSRGHLVFRPFKHGQEYVIQGRELNLVSALGPKVRSEIRWISEAFEELNKTWYLRNPDLSPILPEPDDRLVGGDPGSRWLSSVVQRILSTELRWKYPNRPGVEEGILEIGSFLKDVIRSGILDDCNEEWESLLRVQRSLLTETFVPHEYDRDEKAKLKRPNQIQTDPLIHQLRVERKRRSLVSTSEVSPPQEGGPEFVQSRERVEKSDPRLQALQSLILSYPPDPSYFLPDTGFPGLDKVTETLHIGDYTEDLPPFVNLYLYNFQVGGLEFEVGVTTDGARIYFDVPDDRLQHLLDTATRWEVSPGREGVEEGVGEDPDDLEIGYEV